MANLNKVMLIGNLTRDPELRYTPKGSAVAEFGLAINRVWYNEQKQKQEETTFVDITLWARQAEIAQQYLTKGSPVYIEGRLSLDTWDDKATGQKRSKIKVVGETLQLLGSKNHSGGGAPQSQGPPPSQQRSAPPQGASPAPTNEFQDEDEIPF
ncbi:MAG: single-stranded DNA-binding protein [Verrucomicrobiota bacterium]